MQRLASAQHAVILAHRMRRTFCSHGLHLALPGLPLFPAHIAQCSHGMIQYSFKEDRRLFALLAPLIVLTIHQRMFHTRVADHETGIVTHIHGLNIQRTKIAHDQLIFLCIEAGDLIH